MLSDDLLEFVRYREPFTRGRWFTHNGVVVYLRNGRRIVGTDLVHTTTIANVTSTNPGEGRFTAFLEELEAEVGSIYIENILNKRLLRFFAKRGYVILDTPYDVCAWRVIVKEERD